MHAVSGEHIPFEHFMEILVFHLFYADYALSIFKLFAGFWLQKLEMFYYFSIDDIPLFTI